jgi:hypothetical protein
MTCRIRGLWLDKSRSLFVCYYHILFQTRLSSLVLIAKSQTLHTSCESSIQVLRNACENLRTAPLGAADDALWHVGMRYSRMIRRVEI